MTQVADRPSHPLPDALTGGWLRASISLEGGTDDNATTVWWLQTPTRYADVRVPQEPGGTADSFAGMTTWSAPALTWTHELDLTGWASADTGRMHWDGDLLVEKGTMIVDGDERRYVERWRRLDGSSGPMMALSREQPCPGRIVRTGDVALTLVDARPTGGEYVAVGWRRDGHAWREELRWPADCAEALPPPPGSAVEAQVDLDGTIWTIEEQHP